jgi:glycosyltransferase involved in cell wall biosynthesis
MPAKIDKISVLMAAYNCAEYLPQSIRSVLNQTYKTFELIIIDDGSTDNTKEIINTFNDKRIIYRKTAHKGTSAALNTGLKLCKNQWLARIDADDLNTPTRLETQVRFLAENPDIDVVSSWSVYFRDPAKILFLLKEPTAHADIFDYLDLHNPINQSGMMIRRNKIPAEGFNETFTSNEDYELLYRLRGELKFAVIPQFLVYTRMRNDSRSALTNNKNIYGMLFNPAFKKLINAKSKGDHFYWASVIAWLNYFYGNRRDSRGYFKKSVSLKNLTAYLTTFLPDEYFYKFIDSRARYRLENLFKPTRKYREELTKLLKNNV